jgi:hypothetical protein
MSDIKELRRRVTDAVENFGLINQQRKTYSERLIDLMGAVEGRIREQLDEIEQHKSKIAGHIAEIESQSAAVSRIDQENEQLRDMLLSLLGAIEEGGRDTLAETMQELNRKASALIGSGLAEPEEPVPEEPVPEEPVPEERVPEEPAEPADGAEEPTAENPEAGETAAQEPAEVVAEAEEPAAQEPAAQEPAEAVAEAESEESATENSTEPLPEAEETAAEAPDAERALPGSLDEILERVTKLVQETDAAIAAPEPCAPEVTAEAAEEVAGDAVEEPAKQATGTDS